MRTPNARPALVVYLHELRNYVAPIPGEKYRARVVVHVERETSPVMGDGFVVGASGADVRDETPVETAGVHIAVEVLERDAMGELRWTAVDKPHDFVSALGDALRVVAEELGNIFGDPRPVIERAQCRARYINMPWQPPRHR